MAVGITKRWRRAPEPVFADVGLELWPGECVWLGGRNGAGKTTLLRVLAGILAPDTGWVSLDGLSPARQGRAFRRRLGFLAAGDRGLYARLTVRRQLELWAALCLLSHEERSTRVAESLARFDLSGLAQARVDRISMGQRQRVRLAMTFLHRPTVVLLDEPLTSLDEEAGALVGGAVRETLQEGGACLWVSPAPEAGELAARHLRLRDGGVLEDTG